MVTIKLIGFKGKARLLTFDVSTYKQALEALKTHPDYDPRKVSARFECAIDEVKDSRDLTKEVGDAKMTIRFKKKVNMLTMAGAGNANVRIIVGIILIVVALYMATIDGGTTFVMVMNAMFAMGTGLVIGGIMEKLQDPLETDDKASRVSRRYPNTIESGTPIPLIFGTHRWGGHLFTMNIESLNGADAGLNLFAGGIWNNIGGWDSWETLYQDTSTGSAFNIFEGIPSGLFFNFNFGG